MLFVRFLFVLLVLGSGGLFLWLEPGPRGFVVIGAGLLVLLASFLIEARIRRSALAAREVLTGGLGLLLGLLVGTVTLAALNELPPLAFFSPQQTRVTSVAALLFLCLLGYLGLVAGQVVARGASGRSGPSQEGAGPVRFLLEERALVDGRAVRLAQSPLLAGEIVIPRHVVDALQTMAASKNPLEHVRGERGLENLRALQQIPQRPVRIRELDTVRGEIAGILDFAEGSDTRILTQNPELLAEAARRGIQAIDLSIVADLLKPEVVQGDELLVKLVKPGKEREQAVGYMEDGNMVVVENAREDINRTVRVVVTGIHQTRAGTLIFASKKEGSAIPFRSRDVSTGAPGED